MKLMLMAAIVLSVVMASFAVQNSQVTQVTFMRWYFDAPLVVVLLLTFAAGAVSAYLAFLPGLLRKSMELSRLKKLSAERAAKLETMELQQKTRDSRQAMAADAESPGNS